MFAKAIEKLKCRSLLLFLQMAIHPDMIQMGRNSVEKKTSIHGSPWHNWAAATLWSSSSKLTRLLFKWKDQVFDGEKVNREGFMQILAIIWDVWITKESLIKAARRVGIISFGISINDMQKDKFIRKEAVTQLTPTFGMGQRNTGTRSVKTTKSNLMNWLKH